MPRKPSARHLSLILSPPRKYGASYHVYYDKWELITRNCTRPTYHDSVAEVIEEYKIRTGSVK